MAAEMPLKIKINVPKTRKISLKADYNILHDIILETGKPVYKTQSWYKNYNTRITSMIKHIYSQIAEKNNCTCDRCNRQSHTLYFVPNKPIEDVLEAALVYMATQSYVDKKSLKPGDLYSRQNQNQVLQLCLQFLANTETQCNGEILCPSCHTQNNQGTRLNVKKPTVHLSREKNKKRSVKSTSER